MIVYVVTRDLGGHLDPAVEVFAVMTTAEAAATAALVALRDAPESRVDVTEYATDVLPVSYRRVASIENG